MIRSTTHNAHFAASRVTMAGEVQHKSGITAVVGRNGSGKSFTTIEVPRWLLFGKKALRGDAADYKGASATGFFEIRGVVYEISRGKEEWIKDSDGTTLAVGAEKVTEKVTELLGYGLDVFDICNASTQHNTHLFSSKTPGERKALIDRVLRLTETEKAEKDCRAEARRYRTVSEALARQLVKPDDMPIKPDNYAPAAQLRAKLEQDRETMVVAGALRDRIRDVEPPQPPSEPLGDLEGLRSHEAQRRSDEAERAVLEDRASAPAPTYTEDQLLAMEARLEWELEVERRGPRATLTQAQIDEDRATWTTILGLREQEDREIECPKCHHSFRTRGNIPDEPRLSLKELREQEKALERWAEPLPPEPSNEWGRMMRTDTARHWRAIERHKGASEARLLLEKRARFSDKAEELAKQERLAIQWDNYKSSVDRHEKIVQANAAAQAELDALGPVPTNAEIDELADRIFACAQYESAASRVREQRTAFDKLTADIAEQDRLAEEFRLGSIDLGESRALVKSLIAPRISSIASALIYDMTMGELSDVVVTEDMEVTVNGQKLQTLSGAGLTVANLALRIALGQALVANAFPVFLADEIDGDLDDERREATMKALEALKKHLEQIILVTHKGADVADHILNTG